MNRRALLLTVSLVAILASAGWIAYRLLRPPVAVSYDDASVQRQLGAMLGEAIKENGIATDSVAVVVQAEPDDRLDGLREALAGTELQVISLADLGLATSSDELPVEQLRKRQAALYLEQLGKHALVIGLTPLPPALKPDRRGGKLAVIAGNTKELREMLATGAIAVAIVDLPGAPAVDMSKRPTPAAIVAQRYLVVTPATADRLGK